MKIVLISTFALLTGMVNATEKQHYRQWVDSTGKSVTAKFESYSNGKVTLKSVQGDRQSFAIKSLSDADKAYLRSTTRDNRIKFKHPELKQSDRLLVPSITETPFGTTDENCGPDAVANFMLWWDRHGVLPLPYKDKDTEDLTNRLQRELEASMRCSTNTKKVDFVAGLKHYFKKRELHEWYDIKVEHKDATLDSIKEATKGDQLAVLSLQILKNGKQDESHFVSLISFKDDVITFDTWGQRFSGRLKPGVNGKEEVLFVELTRSPGSFSYDWITEQGGGFVITKKDYLVTTSISKLAKKREMKKGFAKK